MGLQLDSLSQSSFEQHGPWHFHDIRFKREEPVDLSSALLRVSTLHGFNDRLSELPKSVKGELQSKLWPTGKPSQISPPLKSMFTASSSLDLSTQASSSTIFASSKPIATVCSQPLDVNPVNPGSKDKVLLAFPIKGPQLPSRPALKRRRPDSDVDGPNTASLSCKKRRLLRHLITSRLSEPFSLPATHILNRESVASSDKRFLKLATILAARKMNTSGAQQHPLSHPNPSTILRRTAVFNRLRLRLQMSARESDSKVPDLAGTSTSQGPQPGPAFSAQFPNLAPVSYGGPPIPPSRNQQQGQTHILSRSGMVIRSSPPGSPSGLRPTEKGLLRLPSPRLRPLRSPELRTTRPAIDITELDDLYDDNISFPSSEHESRYDDDPDDVYADFGLIFGGGGDGELSDEENSAEQFEDVMDDLDGIPWNARC